MGQYGPNESEQDIILERYSLVGDLLCGIAYGASYS